MEMDFRIGDRVRVREFDNIPESIRHKGYAKNAGKDGEIVDIMYSNAKDCYIYTLHLDGVAQPSRTEFLEGTFDFIPEVTKPTYRYEIECLENLVVARLYEVTDDTKTEVAKGHGHIFHDGAYGVAQAASYACKRMWMDLGSDEYGQN